MKAIRVLRRGAGAAVTTVHWLTDDEGTRCGRDTSDLQIVEDLDLDRLPRLEACLRCQRYESGEPTKPDYVRTPLVGPRPSLPASLGRMSKVGPLRKTGISGYGHPLR